MIFVLYYIQCCFDENRVLKTTDSSVGHMLVLYMLLKTLFAEHANEFIALDHVKVHIHSCLVPLEDYNVKVGHHLVPSVTAHDLFTIIPAYIDTVGEKHGIKLTRDQCEPKLVTDDRSSAHVIDTEIATHASTPTAVTTTTTTILEHDALDKEIAKMLTVMGFLYFKDNNMTVPDKVKTIVYPTSTLIQGVDATTLTQRCTHILTTLVAVPKPSKE